MNQCVAITTKRDQCKHTGHVFESLCKLHHNIKYNKDPAYKLRYDSRGNVAVPILMHGPAPEAPTPAPEAPAEPKVITAEELEKNRVKQLAARTVLMEELSNPTISLIRFYTERSLRLWLSSSTYSLDCVKTYYILNYLSFQAVDKISIINLLKAIATVNLLMTGRLPNDQRIEIYEALRTALIPFGEIDLLRSIPSTNTYYRMIRRRIWEQQREQLQAAERAAIQEQRRQLAIQLREEPVIFKRDPEGRIDLASFSTDTQNIHRSSVQTATQKAVLQLITRSVDPGQETLTELILDLENPKKIRILGTTRERIIMEVQHDYYECVAFSISYGEVLDRVWSFIRNHKDRQELFVRLAQEITEGIGMCTNGKMARLVNVLQGFDETLLVDAPKEVFQEKFALLRTLPNAAGERGVAAQALFEEFSIPEAERAVWLEALLEE